MKKISYRKLTVFLLLILLFSFFFISDLFFIIILIFIILYMINIYLSVKFAEQVPNIFKEKRRNLKVLIFGSTTVWSYLKREENLKPHVKSFAFFKRNINTDFLILKRLYSFLDNNGKILITIEHSENIDNLMRINPCDAMILHPLTRTQLGIEDLPRKSKNPLLFNFCFSISYLIEIAFHKLRFFKIFHIDEYCIDSSAYNLFMKTYIRLINNFCFERNLSVDFIFLNKCKMDEDMSNLIIEDIGESIKCYSIVKIDEINQLLDSLGEAQNK